MKIIFLNTWEATRSPELRAYIESQKKDTDIFCLQEAGPRTEKLIEDLFPA